MSAKNKLQEAFPHHEIKYETMRTGGTDHLPMFTSKVYVNRKCEGVSSPCNSKTAAEQDAASKAIINLRIDEKKEVKKEVKRIDSDVKNTWILIDLENAAQGAKDIEAGKNVSIMGFLRFDHQLDLMRFHFKVELAHSAHKDACDIFMSLKAAEILTHPTKLCQKLILVSHDHFAHALKDILSHQYPSIQIIVQSKIL